MTQEPLNFGEALPVREPTFDGATYDPELDRERLKRQWKDVLALMRDGQWRTLQEISARTKASEASVSARLRDLRKERFGGWNVDRRRVVRGLFEYRVVKP